MFNAKQARDLANGALIDKNKLEKEMSYILETIETGARCGDSKAIIKVDGTRRGSIIDRLQKLGFKTAIKPNDFIEIEW